jgi:Holliday junction DNA helicase RuvA
MIGYLKGSIIDKSEKTLLLLTQGIGYRVFAGNDLIATALEGQELELYIHTSVREDDISLFGFQKKVELDFFEKLISVSGIGPRMALDILSTPLSMVQNAIIAEDIAVLTKIKGLGKKTAERLVLELKNKISPSYTTTEKGSVRDAVNEDAVLALESLGYERHIVLKSMSQLPEEIKETEEIVKFFLKNS